MYDATVAELNEDAPDWLATRRQEGLEAWANAMHPVESDEDWRYVDLDFSLDDYRPTQDASPTLADDEFLGVLDDTAGRITMIDGCVVEARSDEAAVGTIADVEFPGASNLYGASVSPNTDIFAAAHHALSPAGAVVNIPPGSVLERPIVVDVQSVRDGGVSFPHLTFVGGANAQASIVVVYRSDASANLLSVPILETIAGDGARLGVTVVQNLAPGARMVGHHQYRAARDATLTLHDIGLGGGYARQRMGIDLDGAGSSVRSTGIYFGDSEQVLDYRIFVTHRGPRTTSDIFLKGAVADQAQAVWTGLMRIENGANGTSAFETNRNLVLSDGAKVNSVPNLEILTDDLQCGHGSSSGPLEQEHLYYLMSRGLHRRKAERLLVRGFFDEILSGLETTELAEPARRAVAGKFAAAQGRAA